MPVKNSQIESEAGKNMPGERHLYGQAIQLVDLGRFSHTRQRPWWFSTSVTFLYLACDEVQKPGQVLNAWLDNGSPLTGFGEKTVKTGSIRFRCARTNDVNQGDQYLSLAYRKTLSA